MPAFPPAGLLFVGADVAAHTARIRWVTLTTESAQGFSIPLTAQGFTDLKARLLALLPRPEAIHVSLEACGSYHIRLAHFLHEQGFAVSVLNALCVRRFAEGERQLDKTDDLDALTLARYGLQKRPALWTPPPPIHEELFQRLMQRQTLVKLHAQAANRSQAWPYRIRAIEAVQLRHKALCTLLKRQIRSIERELQVILTQEPAWAQNAAFITSIPGVGLVTAAWLLMLTTNFTACTSPKQLAAFVDLVPRQRQSGTSLNTQRSIGHVGHDDIRQHLFIVTLACLRYNSVIRAYYDQVKTRRHRHKLACIAAIHKLLNLIWAVVHNQTYFNPDLARQRPKRADQ
jgi:transposase